MPVSSPSHQVIDTGVFFRLSQTPMAVLDENQCIRVANAAWAQLLGASCDALGGLGLDRALPRGAASGQPFLFGGPSRWLRLEVQQEGDFALATLVDVTREQDQLVALRTDHETRDALLQDAMVGAWRYDPDTETYHFATALDLGYPYSPTTELRTLERVQHKADAPKDAAIRERITTHGGSAEEEIRYRHADGSWVHLHVRYRAGRRLPSGRYEMYGLSQNITPHARARDEAAAGAQRLRLALQAARAAVFEYDYATHKFWTSPELAALTDASRLRQAADNPLLLFHPDHQAEVAKLRASASRGEQPAPIDVRVERADDEIWMRFYLEVEHDAEGRPARASACCSTSTSRNARRWRWPRRARSPNTPPPPSRSSWPRSAMRSARR